MALPETRRGRCCHGDEESTDAGSDRTDADSTCYNSVGQRKTMRLFVCHENGRDTMDVPEGKTVGAIKQIIKENFKIRVDQVQLGDINFERNTLVLSYAGAELDDRWVLSDMGIRPGATLRAFVKEEIDPVLYLRIGYNDEVMPILDRMKLAGHPVLALRSLASRRTGLPVGVFRMTSPSGREMFDCHPLDAYGIRPGDVIGIETWDGWSDLLKLAALGFTSHVLEKFSATDDVLAKFQMKVALYMAAHFGQVELSTTLTRQLGVRCDEAVGPHPLKQWCTVMRHPDLKKAPIHEAVEAGQLSVLRSFVHHNVCAIMVRDGNGLQPLNLALRQKQKSCASFLLTKQWSRISYNNSSVPLAIFARMKNWTEKAKDKVAVVFGQEKSSLKKKQIKDYPLIGQGVYIDGFSKQQMTSSQRAAGGRRETAVSRSVQQYYSRVCGDPELHFRAATKSMKLPKQKTKWAKMAGNKEAEEAEASGSRLPPLQRQKQKAAAAGAAGAAAAAGGGGRSAKQSRGVEEAVAVASRPSSAKSLAAEGGRQQQQQQPPAQQQQQQQQQQAGGKQQHREAASQGKKSAPANFLKKGNDAAIPLPLHSIEDTPRPFLHLKQGEVNEVQQVLARYHAHRGAAPRDYAIQCLSVAQNFKEKPWLHQVRLAMAFTETGVRNMTCKRSHNLLSPRLAAE